MKKRILALLLTGAMVFGLAACSSGSGEASPAGTGSGETAPAETESAQTVKVGMVCIGDENDQGYTYNIMRGVSEATEMLAEKGINVEWVTKYNVPENAECEDACCFAEGPVPCKAMDMWQLATHPCTIKEAY